MSGCFVGRIQHRSDGGHRLQPPALQESPVQDTTIESQGKIVEKEVSLSETSEYSTFIRLQAMPECSRPPGEDATMTQSTVNTSKAADRKKTGTTYSCNRRAPCRY